MNVKAKKNNHFLNLLEDRKLAEQYFSGKNMTEFNSLQLIKLQKNCKMIKTKYSQKLWLLSIYSFLCLENYDLALKTEHEHKKMMSSIRDLDVFESNLSYLLISGIISYEQCKQLGFDSDYIENLLEKYKKIADNSYIEYDYDEQRGTTSEINEYGKALILPYTPIEVRRKIQK